MCFATAGCTVPGAKILCPGRQAVVVTPTSSTAGTLTMFEREEKSSPWRQQGSPVPVSLGSGGLAAGRGKRCGLPAKTEGDGRTPVGTYPLGPAFGRPASFPTRMPYLRINLHTEAVDDSASRFYNRIVDRRRVATPDWKSSEEMFRSDHLYDLGIVVGYNTKPARPGKGSCIFLHIWKLPGATTAGCVAMSRADLERIVRWLEPAAKPVIVIRPPACAADKANI